MPSIVSTPAAGVDTRQPSLEPTPGEVAAEAAHERWSHWPVSWSAVWVGALAAVAAVVLFGLIGTALGAHFLTPEHRVVDLRKLSFGALAFSVISAFLAFVIGGWVAGKVAGILRAEPGMLHGGIVWLVAVPLLVLLAALGAGSSMGGWFGGMASSPNSNASTAPYERPVPPDLNATEAERAQYRSELADYNRKVQQWRDDAPKVARNSALGATSALLLGLIGSVLGGWMASGEPMTFTHYRKARPGEPQRVPVVRA
jgi:hypothetical protein